MDFTLDFKLPASATLEKGEETRQVFDVVILGGGPAGMTAAIYAARKALRTLLLSPDLGGQVLTTSGIENYMGFQYISGPELAAKFSEQVQNTGLKLILGEKATLVTKTGETFFIRTDGEREIQGSALIIATGKRTKQLNVSGEMQYRGRGVSYCSVCDGPFFKGKPVVVVGGGNSALTAAVDMLGLGSAVTLVNYQTGWQADEVLLKQVKEKATLLDGHSVREILGDGTRVTGVKLARRDSQVEKVIDVSGVFIEIGLVTNTDLFTSIIKLNAQGEIETNAAALTSLPGAYAAGDCTTVPEKQIIIAAGEGAKAALAAYRFLKNIPEGNNY